MSSSPAYSYKAVFTDGVSPRHTIFTAPDIEFAYMKARTIARDIIDQKTFGKQDWSKWRVVVESKTEGRREGAFLD